MQIPSIQTREKMGLARWDVGYILLRGLCKRHFYYFIIKRNNLKVSNTGTSFKGTDLELGHLRGSCS